MQKVGKLWQDVAMKEKKIYLALLAKHRITKRYKSYHQYLRELIAKPVLGSIGGRFPTLLRSLASSRDFDYRLSEGSWAWNDRAFCKYWRLPDWSSDLEYLSWSSNFIGVHTHPGEHFWQLSAVSFSDPPPAPALPPNLAARFGTYASCHVKYWKYGLTAPGEPPFSLIGHDAIGTRPLEPNYRFVDQGVSAADGRITAWLRDGEEAWLSELANVKVPEVLPSIAPKATHESFVTSNSVFSSPFLIDSSNRGDDTFSVAAVSSDVQQAVDITKQKSLKARKRTRNGCLSSSTPRLL